MYSINIKINTKLITRLYSFTNNNWRTKNNKLKQRLKKFCVKIAGESMINAGLYPGAIVEIARGLTPCHNDIILAKLDGTHTIKRLWINEDNTTFLLPENFDFEPINVADYQSFDIEGVVTRIVS